MEKEHMFDGNSFQEEITSKEEAKAAFDYFTHNLQKFQSELASEGQSYEEIENTLRQCWSNLIESCQRAGYSNPRLDAVEKSLNGQKKELPKKTNK
jgi:hypothetical protein